MSYASPDFGTVNIERPKVTAENAFWATAPRDGFTRICEAQRWDHMINSKGESMVSGAVVVGYLEGPQKQKGAR